MQFFLDSVYFVAFNIATALFAPIKSDSFLFWPFLLTAFLLAVLSWLYWHRGDAPGKWAEFRSRYFSRQLWWHRSARADYSLYFVNALLWPLLFASLLFNQFDIVHLFDLAGSKSAVGIPSATTVSIFWRAAYTLMFFVAYDFGRFVAHCLLHDVAIFWEFHKVHHSAEVLTPMTAFRAHPVDLLIMAWGGAFFSGIVTWGFNRMSDAPVDMFTFLGLHVLLWLGNTIGNLRHTRVWLTYGSRLGKWLISPAHHQLHHSCERQHIGCNRGFDLAIWDRLYGTLYVPTGAEQAFEIGLDDGTSEQWQSVSQMLFKPFANVFRQLRKR
ncbi:MAG: sterol desaturase family protein [Rhodocyclaceae bacterium]|nr:sterol desaturase family protein [Rhodocyclaceae bacterium]MBL0075226.1 sterol desaturase family protein [Rhodocyclaceae bacterium]